MQGYSKVGSAGGNCLIPTISALSPATDSVCEEKKLTQTQSRTRTCKATCRDVQCLKTEIKEVTADDTQEIDCETACDKNSVSWKDWQPTKQASEVCKGTSLPQTREGTFSCPRDKCKVCATGTTAQRNLKGTKVTPCQTPHCTAWQAVSDPDGTWQPARDTVVAGQTFTQTRAEKRTCNLTCSDPDNPCQTTRKNTRGNVSGTKKPFYQAPTVPTCNQCSTGCEAWQAWGAWTAETSCPTTLAFGSTLPQESTERRNRARTCNNNLCADAVCFTSNSETRTMPCSCPAGRVLAADGTCICNAAERKYRVGNECQQCPRDYNFKQVNGTQVCEQTCTCCDDWVETSVSQQASDVCANLTFTPEYTYARNCGSCPAGNTCSETKTELATLAVPGTKTTENCKEHCTAWGTWSYTAAKTCPANTSFASSTITYTGERTRTCSGLCSASDCDTTDNTGSKTENCAYCEGTGQKKLAEGICVCDAGGRYYRTGNTCTQCPADREFQNGNCRACTAQEELQNGVCVAKPSTAVIEEASVEVPEYETCEAGCSNWDMTDWTWTLTTDACQDPASFAKSTLTAEIATRTRTRTCKNLKAGLGCFTSNTETRTMPCSWCQGTGQEIDTKGTATLDDECVCKHSSGYVKQDNECVECSEGQVLVEAANSQWQCSTACDDVCGAWGARGDRTPVAGNVCSEEKFTPQQTWERTCPAERTDCSGTKTVKGEETVGTKTVVCDDACSDYGDFGDWTATGTCPTSTTLGAKFSIAEKRIKTRTCPQELCGETCLTSLSTTKTTACPCTGTGQTSLIDGTCVCNRDNDYYANGNDCKLCDSGNLVKNQNGAWECKAIIVPTEQTEQVVTPECQETCAAACVSWNTWTSWTAPQSCPTRASFTAPPQNTEKTRTRQRTCDSASLCENVECFTNNIESKTCEWCKGKGQKKLDDMGVCICDANSNYYRANREADTCVSCGNKIVNITRNGCECADSSCIANSKKEWDSTNCVCGECKQEHVDACGGEYSINKETCACKVITSPPPPSTMQVRLYYGCFYMRPSHPLYVPVKASKVIKDKWKNTCLSTAGYTYKNAATTLQGATTATVTVTQIIQTLYDCAKDSGSDRKSVRIHKEAFITELRNADKECLDRASEPYWVTITID